MPGTPLQHVHVFGLHDQQEVAVDLEPGLNLIYGRNGSGKTTFLHILANLADRDLERFCFLRFEKIVVRTARSDRLVLTQSRSPDGTSVALEINGAPAGKVARGEVTPPGVRNVLKEVLGGRPVYLPAFRAILEAITESRGRYQYLADHQREQEISRIVEQLRSDDEEESPSRRRARYVYGNRDDQATAYKTALCRDWFGAFVPVVRFPSLAEVAEQLAAELQEAQFEVASTDRTAFSEVFVKVLHAVVSGAPTADVGSVEPVLASIRESLASLQATAGGAPSVYYEIAALVKEHSTNSFHQEAIASQILQVYEQALKDRTVAQRRAFRRIRTFEESVNRFLQHKKLSVEGADSDALRARSGRARMISLEGGKSANLSVLSSGERHVLTLLFSATHMSTTEGMLLIDEPELSLHVDWQRVILGELMKQAGDRQIIACTHAPEVTAEHRRAMTKLGTKYLKQQELFEDDMADQER